MFGKHTLFLFLLVAVLAGPIIYYNDWPNLLSIKDVDYANLNLSRLPSHVNNLDLSANRLSQPVSTIPVAPHSFVNEINPSRADTFPSPPASPFPSDLILPGTANGPDFNAVPLEFMPVANLNEIFRFDANPAWVRQRWDRVSITNDKTGLSGLRVPLVTGVNASDLFGSLTYYFDSNQTVQKMAFRGWTGNPNGLVEFVTRNHDFKNQPTSAAGLYLAKNWRKSTGALYMQHPNYVSAQNPTQQVAILLEINNPNGSYELSSDVASMIFNSQK